MPGGLYPDLFVVERYTSSSVSTGTTFFPKYVAPFDFDIVGLIAYTSTQTSGGALTFNINSVLTSQATPPTGAANANAPAVPTGSTTPTSNYTVTGGVLTGLWSATNVPTIPSGGYTNLTTANSGLQTSGPFANENLTLVQNQAYALKYPLPGAPTAATTGYVTAQSNTLGSNSNAVTVPPSTFDYVVSGGIVAPDQFYVDINNVQQPSYRVNAGDVLTFVAAGAGTASAGAAVQLIAQRR